MSKLVIGDVGTGKTYKEVIPAINNWNGSVLVFDITKQLFSYTSESRKEKGIIIDQIDFADKSGISIALDMITKKGNAVYLYTERNKESINTFSENLDILFQFVLNTSVSNLLIILDEFQTLDYLSILPLLLRTGRKKNIFVLMALPAKDENHLRTLLNSTGYNQYESDSIVNNCTMVIRTDYRL